MGPEVHVAVHGPKPSAKAEEKRLWWSIRDCFCRKFKSRAAPLAATPVAHVAVDHTILGSMVLGRFHLGFCLIPDYFHGHFCLGAGVFDPQHGDCQQPSVTSVYFELA